VPHTSDMLTYQVAGADAARVLGYLKEEAEPRFRRLDDLTAVDESARRERPTGAPDYTLYYQLLSLDSASRIRLKVPLHGPSPQVDTVTGLWPSAGWYEREAFEMFGIGFQGHPDLRRLITPPEWVGYPLRKSHPGRATEMAPYTLEDARALQPLDAGVFVRKGSEEELLLNVGPHHVGTHGLLRVVLALHGEEIRDVGLDIGYHHRGVEKIGERQSWTQFIPYTDRVDYLGGLCNNLSYVTAVETLAGISVPDRAEYVRAMLSELYRISNHLLWFATFTHDTGAMSPNFYAFREREMVLDIAELITGGRLHPSWLRLGGLAADLPEGWREKVDAFVCVFPQRLREYERLITRNPIFEARTRGIGSISRDEALDWGMSGPMLRACGVEWDLRKKMPYGAYPAFDFEIPTAEEGDCYARYRVRMEEMRQSLRIIEQAARDMPPGRYVTDDYRYAVPEKRDTLRDIESLIHHFINVTRGPKIPAGEAYHATEVPRGEQGYFVASDGLNMAYRMRIRAPDFAHLQALPLMARGAGLADLVPILGSMDFILPDTDR
ncbi:MAG: NADH dehydrogenase (quinone) subunit D, partial [Proteobacteria bacterium]|nr:NADH dehydrogenase (quinone) subunit D [Pseudomonadota bacterium]